MKLAVLGSSESWYVQDLRRAGSDRHEVVPISFRSLASQVRSTAAIEVGSPGLALHEFDAVLVRTMPSGSLEQVVFRMDALAQLQGRGVPVVNPPKAIEAAVDKYLTTARLAAEGLLVPHTIVCQSAEQASEAFARLGSDVVIKPVFGSEGRGIARIRDEAIAWRTFRLLEQMGAVLYLQQPIEHEGEDIRLFVLGEQVWGIRRKNAHDWRTNINRGAVAEPLEVTPPLAALARRSAAAVGAEVAGVDILPGRDGRLYVLEVNAVPGWRALGAALQIDVAKQLLKFLEAASTAAKQHGSGN